MTLLENKKQLHYCINAIRNRILILLNIISKQGSLKDVINYIKFD